MTNKPMTNLEQITLAASWGWSATIEYQGETWQVVGDYLMWKGEVPLSYLNLQTQFSTLQPEAKHCGDNCEILGYLYAGQLLGSEPIPEGQRFRVKGAVSKDREILTFYKINNKESIICYDKNHKEFVPFKSEIEPFFN